MRDDAFHDGLVAFRQISYSRTPRQSLGCHPKENDRPSSNGWNGRYARLQTGATVRAVLAELETRGAHADRHAVELFLRARGWPQVKTGHYEIPAQASSQEILRQLAEGRVVLEALTVIEGWTFADMRRAVEAHAQIKVTLRGKTIAEVMSAIELVERYESVCADHARRCRVAGTKLARRLPCRAHQP